MKKIISIFLSVLLLASSTGIAYAQHFCGGEEMMAEITLGQKNLSCGMDDISSDCGEETVISVAHDCCSNQFTKVSTDDNFAKATFNISLNKTFVAAFVPVFVLQQIPVYDTTNHYYADYNPPPIDKDISILYQTFLI